MARITYLAVYLDSDENEHVIGESDDYEVTFAALSLKALNRINVGLIFDGCIYRLVDGKRQAVIAVIGLGERNE